MVNEDNYQAIQENLYTKDCEKAIVSSCLSRSDLIDDLPEYLQPEHFGDKNLGEVFKGFKSVHSKGLKITDQTLIDAMPKEVSERIGGKYYLVELLTDSNNNNFVYGNTITYYAEKVYDCYKKRELRRILEETFSSLISSQEKSDELIESLETKVFNLSEFQTQNKIISFGEGIDLMLRKTEEAYKGTGAILTEFKAIDRIIGGLYPSDLYILAARTSMGKTALATNIAYNVVTKEVGRKVLFFSLEMSVDQLVGRIIAPEAKIPYSKIRKGLNPDDYATVDGISRHIRQIGLHMDESSSPSIADILTRSRQFKRQHHGLDLIIVDYLQLIEEKEKKMYNRNEEVSKITRGLKKIARDLDVPIIALSQLSRAVENREGNQPQMSDLRDSGSIEQDADGVMLVYRPGYYSKDNKDKRVEVNIVKNRNGPKEVANLNFDGQFTKFSDLD